MSSIVERSVKQTQIVLTLLVSSQLKVSSMFSGVWTVIIQADQSDFAVERTFTLTVGNAEKTVVTVSWPGNSTPKSFASVLTNGV